MKKRREPKRYSADAEAADIPYRAAQQPRPQRIQDVLEAQRKKATELPQASVNKGGRPKEVDPKVVKAVEAELERLEQLSTGKKLSPGRLAKLLGVSKQTIVRYLKK